MNPKPALACGAAGLAACLAAAFSGHAQVARSYWFAWLFWSGLGFGSLAMLMLQHLTGGAWGEAVRRPAGAAVATLPLTALLLVPMLFALPEVFPWARPAMLATAGAPHKHAYLTTDWFTARATLYFLVCVILSQLLRRGGTGMVSGPGLVAFVVCMNFASTDWVMSIEPDWYSTMFAVIFMIGQLLSAMALAIVFLTRTASGLTTKQLHDLGNMLMTLVVFWAYVSFSQFLIIWSGNLPREIAWYVHRRDGGWAGVAGFLALFQFAVPLALLLSRAAKQHARRLGPIAGMVLLANVVNVFWLVAPAFHPQGFRVHWLDAAAFIGIGGIWLAAFQYFLKPLEARS
jgi:hypothetical protein